MDADTAQARSEPGGSRPPGRGDADGAVTALFRAHHLELVRLALLSGAAETGTVAPSSGGRITDPFSHLMFDRVDRGRVTPLPDPADQGQLAAAW